MFGWSTKRRLFYLGLILLVLIIFAGFLWLRSQPAPSCFDNKNNQGELDTDCGGPCARVCPFEVKPAREIWSRLFKIDDNRYDAVTLLRNPNNRYSARQLGYRIKVFDYNDVLISTKTGEVFLNPGEDLYIYNGRLDVGNREPKRALFEIVSGPIWQRVDPSTISPQIIYKSFVNQPTPLLVAEVKNDSLATITDLQVVAVLSDAEENAIAISSTLVEKLLPQETREIVFTWPKTLTTEPTFFDFHPHFDLVRVR